MAHDVVMHAWLGATVGVVPSVWGEPCPTTALEAAASGTPLVASRIGGFRRSWPTARRGCSSLPATPTSSSAALQRLLGDGELRRSMGATAEGRAERFGVDAVVERLEAIYWERAGQRAEAGTRRGSIRRMTSQGLRAS